MTAFFPRPPAELLPEFARLLERKTLARETPEEHRDLDLMMLYLEKALGRAVSIRRHATAGSYLERVLQRTINGLEAEVAQLKYLLAKRDHEALADADAVEPQRMRPAL